MMTDEIPTLTEAEFLSHGINPHNIFPVDRTVGKPLVARFGDDLITRTENGLTGKSYGYFSEHQVAFRKNWSAKIVAECADLPWLAK